MSQYLILINGDEKKWDAMAADDWAAVDEGHRQFRSSAGDAILSSGQLEGTDKWSSVRADASGTPTVHDGPFAETKEVIGGYYLVDVADAEAAASLAELLHEVHVGHSGVDIVPLVVH